METGSDYRVELLVTSDLHGHIRPINYRTREELGSGLAKLAAMIRRERERTPELMLIDNGDLLQGSPLAYYSAAFGKDRINPCVSALNELGYDAAVIGNHEFNYGLPLLRKAASDSNFPWLSAGIVDEANGEPSFGRPYIVKMINNRIKVAVLGVTTHLIPNWENPAHIEGLRFRDALAAVKEWVPRIRSEERPDLLVVAYHGGFERDLSTGEETETQTGENQGYAMCTEADGIDVLITGHQHRFLAGEVNGVTVIQPGSAGQVLGKISVVFREGDDGQTLVIADKKAELLEPEERLEADERVMALTSRVEEDTQQWLDRPLGRVIGDMRIGDPFACRCADHPFIEFMNNVQMEAAGARISAASLLSEQSTGFGDGITMRDIMSSFVYPNTLAVLRLSGADIRAALERTADYFIVDDDGRLGVNPSYIAPKAQHYNYDMWEGVEYEIDAARPAGSRITRLTIDGLPLDERTEYEVVMNNYRAAGGGDYPMFQGKPAVREVQIDMAELAAGYVLKHGVIEATCNHNWRVIGGRTE